MKAGTVLTKTGVEPSMPISSEVFVMLLFVAGAPIFISILKKRYIPEHRLFLLSYLFLMFSNIFSVVEEFWFECLFNPLEHLFITFAAVSMLTTVVRLSNPKNTKRSSDPTGRSVK